jgi:hypothetical protein
LSFTKKGKQNDKKEKKRIMNENNFRHKGKKKNVCLSQNQKKTMTKQREGFALEERRAGDGVLWRRQISQLVEMLVATENVVEKLIETRSDLKIRIAIRSGIDSL